MSQSPEQIYLFTMFGTRAHALEAMRPIHNRVAGAPEDVAAAKALSDLSHMVYTTVDEQSPAFVIMERASSAITCPPPPDSTTGSSACCVDR